MCVDVLGGIKNPKVFCGCITVAGKKLNTISEVKRFFQEQLDMGRQYLPCGDCDNFDYKSGCKGHVLEENDGSCERWTQEVE